MFSHVHARWNFPRSLSRAVSSGVLRIWRKPVATLVAEKPTPRYMSASRAARPWRQTRRRKKTLAASSSGPGGRSLMPASLEVAGIVCQKSEISSRDTRTGLSSALSTAFGSTSLTARNRPNSASAAPEPAKSYGIEGSVYRSSTSVSPSALINSLQCPWVWNRPSRN